MIELSVELTTDPPTATAYPVPVAMATICGSFRLPTTGLLLLGEGRTREGEGGGGREGEGREERLLLLFDVLTVGVVCPFGTLFPPRLLELPEDDEVRVRDLGPGLLGEGGTTYNYTICIIRKITFPI